MSSPSQGGGVGAQELRAQQLYRGGAVPAEGDPYGVLTGAVATQVVALDLCAQQQDSGVSPRVWVGALRKAADAAASPDLMGRRRAGLRLLLALTDAAENDPDVGLVEAVLLARSTAEHGRAVVVLTGLLDADPRRFSPQLGSAWVVVFGPMLLRVLDEVSDQLGLLRVGKPPLRATGLRSAQRSTVHQLFATGQTSTRTLATQAGVAIATIGRWIHEPLPAVTLQGVGLTTAQCAARAGLQPTTWRTLVHRGLAPKARGGRPNMPLWEETEVQAFLAHRPGPGGARTDRRTPPKLGR